MKLYVIFAQRIETYPGEYAPEALTCMTEYDQECNPEYLVNARAEYAGLTHEFERVEVVTLELDKAALMRMLRPSAEALPATVVA